MKEFLVLLSPFLWSVRNDITRFDRSFYKRASFYFAASIFFIILVTRLLGMGMAKLQSLSPEVFTLLLIKGYSLIFAIIFFIQIVNGLVIALGSYYRSKELEVLFTSPVSRNSLFLSRFIGMHLKASWMLVIFGVPLLVSSGILFHAGPFFYFYALLLFFVFSTIPVNIGACITIFFSSIIHASGLRKFLLSAGVVTVVLLVTLLRVFRPERFVNPELFANLTLFISELNTPSFVLLPNRWLSEAIFNSLKGTFEAFSLVYVALLLLTSYITTLGLEKIFERYHFRGWSLLQEGGVRIKDRPGRPAENEKGPRIPKIVDFITRMFDVRSRVLIKKDILTQMRDPRNIHQTLILLFLVVIYLFSVAALPVNWEGYSVQLRYMVAFFNLGLILIIIAAICSRLIYPAVISETVSVWMLKSAPLTPPRYVLAKFFFFGVPVLVLGQLLSLASSLLIGIGWHLILLQSVTVAAVSFSLVGTSAAFGISGLRRSVLDAAEERSTRESTAQMILSVFLILITLALEVVPVFVYFVKEAQKGVFTQRAELIIGGATLGLILVNLGVTLFSVRFSVKRFDKLEVH